MAAVLFYEYAKCSTCQKAKKWLESHKVAFRAIPIVEEPPTEAQLKQYFEASGLDLKKFFNTSGLSYRALKLSDKLPVMSHKEMLALLATDGKLIKRPLLVDDKNVLVGFKDDDYKKHFGGK